VASKADFEAWIGINDL